MATAMTGSVTRGACSEKLAYRLAGGALSIIHSRDLDDSDVQSAIPTEEISVSRLWRRSSMMVVNQLGTSTHLHGSVVVQRKRRNVDVLTSYLDCVNI